MHLQLLATNSCTQTWSVCNALTDWSTDTALQDNKNIFMYSNPREH